MKKIIALMLAFTLLLAMTACTQKESGVVKVGMVCIGDSTQAYDQNFYKAADAAKAKLAEEGIEIEWVYTHNHASGQEVVQDNETLTEHGCIVVFNNSYGHETSMIPVAQQNPDVIYVACTNEESSRDSLENTLNAFPDISQARYLAGVAAGLKLNELIDEGTITPEEAVIGYVGAYTFAEVISGYTAFYLGAKSVCPSVTMKVVFIGSWGNFALEQEAATTLIDDYHCVLISQHSDQTSPAAVAEAKGVYHIGYNVDMSDVAPNYSIVSSRIDWTNYFVKVIKAAINGEKQDQDYIGYGLETGDVTLTDINSRAAADNTEGVLAQVKLDLINGTIHVFDTDTFTVNGEKVTSFLVDMTGDYVGDAGYDAIFDGYFHEGYFKSAPCFSIRIDGIELVNEAF